jgi:hypothetical protein
MMFALTESIEPVIVTLRVYGSAAVLNNTPTSAVAPQSKRVYVDLGSLKAQHL